MEKNNTKSESKSFIFATIDDLLRRNYDHKEKSDKKSFTARYNVNKLVYFEEYSDAYSSISREKQIKTY